MGKGTFRRIGCLSAAALFAATTAIAQQPDKTKVNKQDHSAARVTADQQSNDKSDLEITRDIRRALVADKSLSTYAHNVKIVTKHGQVTLRGPVRSEQEKQTIETKASEVAGAGKVTSSVTVAPAGSTSSHEAKPAKTTTKPTA